MISGSVPVFNAVSPDPVIQKTSNIQSCALPTDFFVNILITLY